MTDWVSELEVRKARREAWRKVEELKDQVRLLNRNLSSLRKQNEYMKEDKNRAEKREREAKEESRWERYGQHRCFWCRLKKKEKG